MLLLLLEKEAEDQRLPGSDAAGYSGLGRLCVRLRSDDLSWPDECQEGDFFVNDAINIL